MIELKDIREGSIVLVRGGFGSEPARKAVVTSVDANIKNGRPGIDYEIAGDSRWAYLEQVTRVELY